MSIANVISGVVAGVLLNVTAAQAADIVAVKSQDKVQGLYVYNVQLRSDNGSTTTIQMVSGRTHKQDAGLEHIADIGSPIPKGNYSITPSINPAPEKGFGGFFIPIEPLFNTARYALGLHHEAEFQQGVGPELGTEGCLATISTQDKQTLIDFVKKEKPDSLFVL